MRDLNTVISVDGNGKKSWQSVIEMLSIETSEVPSPFDQYSGHVPPATLALTGPIDTVY